MMMSVALDKNDNLKNKNTEETVPTPAPADVQPKRVPYTVM